MEQFSSPATTPKKKTHIHYDFDSNSNTYKYLFKEYNHTKPSSLFNDYTKKIIDIKSTKDKVKEELGIIMKSTENNAKNLGGYIKELKKGCDEHNEFKTNVEYLGLYRDTLKTMQSAIDKISLSGTGLLYMNYNEMKERLYILLEHRKGGNYSDLIKKVAGDINDILLKNNIISKGQHKKIYEKIF